MHIDYHSKIDLSSVFAGTSAGKGAFIMITAKDIEKALFTLAPQHYAEDWDNVGLLFGDADAPVDTVLVALDPFRGVIEEAIEEENAA